ncbi:hypothetical protein pb186bvf_005610 [Paramecium bursaria]
MLPNNDYFDDIQEDYNQPIQSPYIMQYIAIQQLMSQNYEPIQFMSHYFCDDNSQNQNHNKEYFQKADQVERQISNFNPKHDPHFLITVVRSDQDKQYIVTQDGLIGSEKNTSIEDIIIGKKYQSNDKDIIASDIVLPQQEKPISRIHARINTKDEFRKFNEIPEQYKIFIKSYHSQKLSTTIQKLILQFVRYNPRIRIQNIPLNNYTQIKIQNKQGQKVESNFEYLIGAENKFILEYVDGGDQNEFITFEEYKVWVQQLKTQYKCGFIKNMPEEFDELQPKRPYLILKLLGTSSYNYQTYLLFGDVDSQLQLQDTYFRIGRNQDSDVHVNNNTISRKQCRIQYNKLKGWWYIFDGDSQKESSNGSWLLLRKGTFESDHTTELKIGDSNLRIEMLNFNFKGRKFEYYIDY